MAEAFDRQLAADFNLDQVTEVADRLSGFDASLASLMEADPLAKQQYHDLHGTSQEIAEASRMVSNLRAELAELRTQVSRAWKLPALKRDNMRWPDTDRTGFPVSDDARRNHCLDVIDRFDERLARLEYAFRARTNDYLAWHYVPLDAEDEADETEAPQPPAANRKPVQTVLPLPPKPSIPARQAKASAVKQEATAPAASSTWFGNWANFFNRSGDSSGQ